MSKKVHDDFTQLTVVRLFKDPDREGKTFTVKKTIFMTSIVSYEQGKSAEFDWEGETIYLVTTHEQFYIAGKFEEFDKRVEDFIRGLREEAK